MIVYLLWPQIANPKDKEFVAKQVKLKQGGVEYPQLAEDSIWYPTDENWQKFARDRQRYPFNPKSNLLHLRNTSFLI